VDDRRRPGAAARQQEDAVSELLEPVWASLRRTDRPQAAALAAALPPPWRAVAAAWVAYDLGVHPPGASIEAEGWLGAAAAALATTDPVAQESFWTRAYHAVGDDHRAAYEVHALRARTRHQRGAYGPALVDARAARAHARAMADGGREAWALSAAGAALVELRDYARARAVHEAASALHTAHGQPGGEVASLGGLGLCALGRHETARGAESLHRAVAMARALGLSPEERAWLRCVAHAMTLLDRNDARREALVRLAALEEAADAPLRAAAAWIDAATAATSILALDDAEHDLKQAEACYAAMPHPQGLLDVGSRRAALDALRAALPARRARWTEAVTLRAPPPPHEA